MQLSTLEKKLLVANTKGWKDPESLTNIPWESWLSFLGFHKEKGYTLSFTKSLWEGTSLNVKVVSSFQHDNYWEATLLSISGQELKSSGYCDTPSEALSIVINSTVYLSNQGI